MSYLDALISDHMTVQNTSGSAVDTETTTLRFTGATPTQLSPGVVEVVVNPTEGGLEIQDSEGEAVDSAVEYIRITGGTPVQLSPGHVQIDVSGGGVSYGTYANRPAPSKAGLLYVCTDMPFEYIDTGSEWLQRHLGSMTTPRMLPYFAARAGGASTDTLIAQGDNVRMQRTVANTSDLVYWQAGNLTTGAGGIWMVTMGVCALDLSEVYSNVGIVVGDATTKFSNYFIFRSDNNLGFGQHLFSNLTTRASASFSTGKYYQSLRSVYWLRMWYNGTSYGFDGSFDGSTWLNHATGTLGAVTGGSMTETPTHWGIGSSYFNTSTQTRAPLDATICHLVQTPTSP